MMRAREQHWQEGAGLLVRETGANPYAVVAAYLGELEKIARSPLSVLSSQLDEAERAVSAMLNTGNASVLGKDFKNAVARRNALRAKVEGEVQTKAARPSGPASSVDEAVVEARRGEHARRGRPDDVVEVPHAPLGFKTRQQVLGGGEEFSARGGAREAAPLTSMDDYDVPRQLSPETIEAFEAERAAISSATGARPLASAMPARPGSMGVPAQPGGAPVHVSAKPPESAAQAQVAEGSQVPVATTPKPVSAVMGEAQPQVAVPTAPAPASAPGVEVLRTNPKAPAERISTPEAVQEGLVSPQDPAIKPVVDAPPTPAAVAGPAPGAQPADAAPAQAGAPTPQAPVAVAPVLRRRAALAGTGILAAGGAFGVGYGGMRMMNQPQQPVQR